MPGQFMRVTNALYVWTAVNIANGRVGIPCFKILWTIQKSKNFNINSVFEGEELRTKT